MRKIHWGISLFLLLVFHAQAAQVSDGDEQLRQQSRERAQRELLESKPDVRLPYQASSDHKPASGLIPAQEFPCFNISQISLSGDASENFQWALKAANVDEVTGKYDPALGQCLGAHAINLIMKRIQNAIIAQGFVTTRVLATSQDLKAGTLALTIIPGRIHAIYFAKDVSRRGTLWNAMPANVGDILNLRDIEQALENFKRVPSAEADIQIIPAEVDENPHNSGIESDDKATFNKPGLSDLVISWKQRLPPFRISVSMDDGGNKSTGKYQGSLTLSADDVLMLNDLFYVTGNHNLGFMNDGAQGEHGTRGYAVHYSVPYGNWLFSFNTSENNYYQSVAGLTQTYRYSGDSQNTDVKLSRLIWRNAVSKTSVGLKAWFRSSSNYVDDSEVQVQRRRMGGWQMDINERYFLGNATIDGTLSYKQGTGAFGALPAPEEGSNEGTSRARIVNADISLNLPFQIKTQALRYNASFRGQWNDTPLVPQDRFAIGGRYTVRGFDGQSLLSADRGWLIRNDLGLSIGDTGQEAYLGIDAGKVGGQSAGRLVGTSLVGAVAGIRGGFKGVNYDIFIGTPLSKPQGFETANTTAGFSLLWSY